MKKITLGIIAHVDSGKTTLSEAILFKTGVIRNWGRVDKGDSFFDDRSLERRRGITIYLKQAVLDLPDTRVTIIDTPGHADFSPEMERALQVLDYAVLIISAADGIKGQTELLWKLLESYKIPTFIFVNKMDWDGADKDALTNVLKRLTNDRAVHFEALCKTSSDLSDIYETISMCSEDAMDEFLETEQVSKETIVKLIYERNLFPCFFGSALKMEGVDELLTALNTYTKNVYAADAEKPSQKSGTADAEKPFQKSGTADAEKPAANGDAGEADGSKAAFGAKVYKVSYGDDGARLTYIKVTSGSLKNKTLLPDGEGESKINQIRFYNGSKYQLQDEAFAGDICVLTGLKESRPGQGFGTEEKTANPFIMPVLSYRVTMKSGEDIVQVLPKLRMLEEEIPEMSLNWDEDAGQLFACVMGEVQLEVLKTVLEERFGLKAEFGEGRIMYRETITRQVIGVGHFEPLRHYAEVHLLLEPLPIGSGMVFESKLKTDILSRNWQSQILSCLKERPHKGVLTGSDITDIKITLINGRAHLKHTEGGDFRQAVRRAVRQGLMMTESVLLEPFYQFTLEVPADSTGRALTDLGQMGAEFSSPDFDVEKNGSVICGRAPVAAINNYPKEIASYTKGRGSITFASDGYGPCHNPEEVIEASAYDPLRDVRNTPDSVFCSGGAGVVVPFDAVYDHMHLDFNGTLKINDDDTDSDAFQSGGDAPAGASGGATGRVSGGTSGGAGTGKAGLSKYEKKSGSRTVSDVHLGTDEVDAIINQISRAGGNTKSAGKYKKNFGATEAAAAGISGVSKDGIMMGRSDGLRKGGNQGGAKGNSNGAQTVPKAPSGPKLAAFAAEDADCVVVDGYNVIFAWPELKELARTNIDGARDALLDVLSNFQGLCGAEMIAVFDAYRVKGKVRETGRMQNVKVVYTAEDETADHYIERLTNELGRKFKVTVVTSDGVEQVIARGHGCKLISSREFKELVNRKTEELNKKYGVK